MGDGEIKYSHISICSFPLSFSPTHKCIHKNRYPNSLHFRKINGLSITGLLRHFFGGKISLHISLLVIVRYISLQLGKKVVHYTILIVEDGTWIWLYLKVKNWLIITDCCGEKTSINISLCFGQSNTKRICSCRDYVISI